MPVKMNEALKQLKESAFPKSNKRPTQSTEEYRQTGGYSIPPYKPPYGVTAKDFDTLDADQLLETSMSLQVPGRKTSDRNAIRGEAYQRLKNRAKELEEGLKSLKRGKKF